MLLGAICLALAACAQPTAQVVVGPPPSYDQAATRLEERRQVVRGFVMQGEIAVETPEGELIGDHLIQGRYPDRLRAEVLGPFGRPVLLMVTDGANLMVVDYDSNAAYLGKATRANLGRFLGLPLSPAEVYSLLVGCPPLLPGAASRDLAVQEPGLAVLRQAQAGLGYTQSLTFALADYRVTEAWLAHNRGDLSLRCRFSEFMPWAASAYPRHVILRETSQERTLTLRNDQLDLGAALDGVSFDVQPPPGLEVRWLGR